MLQREQNKSTLALSRVIYLRQLLGSGARFFFAHCQVCSLFNLHVQQVYYFFAAQRLGFFSLASASETAVTNLELLLQKLAFCRGTKLLRACVSVWAWKKCFAELLLQIDLCLTRSSPTKLAFQREERRQCCKVSALAGQHRHNNNNTWY